MNWLNPDNCNKAKCKSCIFHTNGNQLKLSPERFNEIICYLAAGESSHQCHTTNKNCYGALEYQATIFFRLGWIPKETVQSFLETAKKYL